MSAVFSVCVMNNRSEQAGTIAKYFIGDRLVDDLFGKYNTDYDRHFKMMQNLAASNIQRQPIFYMTNLPFVEPTPGTSSFLSQAALSRYKVIDDDLNLLSQKIGDDEAVDVGAVDTARALVKYLASREIAPPEIAKLSRDAVVMLWALGNTKYAMTVTDGEAGYVIRRARETISRRFNIKVPQFEVVKAKLPK